MAAKNPRKMGSTASVQSQSSNRSKSTKIEKVSRQCKMKHRILSEGSLECTEGTSTDSVMNVVREIVENRIPSLSLQLSAHSKGDVGGEVSWRGWIVTGDVKPIALLTSDPCIKKERGNKNTPLYDVEEDILHKLIQVTAEYEKKELESLSVLAMKNVKLKVKPYSLTDLQRYETKICQGSGTSLFKEDRTGLRRGTTPDIYTDITTKYDLPDVYNEEGSQASSTQLRIFKATVTLKKQPTCSLNEKSRERLFLMFSPSDDNVLDIMNNSQIKNKMLRHEIGKYLKPKRKGKVEITSALNNAPLYTKRRLPSLVPVKEPGILKNYPPLTTEILYDIFFKETEIKKDGYTVMVKEQPLLVENITLCIIPKETISMTPEKKKVGFGPRYSFKDREGEDVPESVRVSKVYRQLKLQPSAPKKESLDSKLEASDTNLVEYILNERLHKEPELKDDIDGRLERLSKHMREKVKTPVEEFKEEPEPDVEATEEAEEVEIPPPRKIRSKWDKFVLTGEKVREGKEKIIQAYQDIQKELEDLEKAGPSEIKQEEPVSVKKEDDVSASENTTVNEQLAEEPEQLVVEEEEPPPEIGRPDIIKIMDQVKKDKLRLKKEKVIPIILPELPKYHSTGKKRFYMTNMQQYWGDYHTDTTTFYHNPIQQFGYSCGEPVINDDRIGAVYIPRKENCDDEIKRDDNDVASSSHSSENNQSTELPVVTPTPILPAPIICPSQVDEIKHELASPKFTYAQDKTEFARLAPSTYYKNSKKEIVALTYFERFLKNYYKVNVKRRKLFLCVENELGVQKIVSTTIKPTGLPFKELNTWQTISKFVSNNVTYVPLENPLYLPHVLNSPSLVLEKGRGGPFDISTLLVSLLIGQGYDAYVVSGYANTLFSLVESSRNYLRYDCPFLVSQEPTDPFQSFNTKSYVVKMIEKSRKPQKQASNYHPTVAPYLDSAYIRQTKLDLEKAKEEEALRIATEEEENACNRYLSFYEADELEGKRIHSWVLVLAGKRNVDKNFFLEPSSGFAYETDDPHYYGIESIWNHQNYWINRIFTPRSNEEPEEKEKPEETIDKEVDEEQERKPEKVKLEFDFANNDFWLPILVNGPQIFKEEKGKKNKAEVKAKILRLQKCLDMPFSWCGRISITTNQVERKINEPFRTSLFKRAVCYEYQAGLNNDGLVARVTKFSDLPRTDPEYEVQVFEKRRDRMYRRRRDVVSDKLTEFFAFGREDCLQSHEFIDGADAMYCDHNLFFNWDFRDDGLISVHMTDLYLRLSYGGRKDRMNNILVLYGSSIEDGKKKRKGAEPGEGGKTPRKEITTIIQQFDPSPDVVPWNDVAKVTYRLTKGEVIVDFQYESGRVTVTTKFINKSHDDPELGQAVAEIAKRKRNKDEDEDCQSELDTENFDKGMDMDDESNLSSDDDEEVITFTKSKSTIVTQSERRGRRGGKKGSIGSRKSSKKSLRDKQEFETKRSTRKTADAKSSEESLKSTRSTKSSLSEGSFGFSEVECSSGEEKAGGTTFYPSKLVADKDKSLWACSRKTKRFLGRKLLNSLFETKRHKSTTMPVDGNNLNISEATEKISDFGHLTKDSSPESSGEEEEYLKELRKRQMKAISETNELYKAIERDEANPNIDSITGDPKSQKLQLCKLEHLVDHARKAESDKKTIQSMKNKLNSRLHETSIWFPNEKVNSETVSVVENLNEVSSMLEDVAEEECANQEESDHLKLSRKKIKLIEIPSPRIKKISLTNPSENYKKDTLTNKPNKFLSKEKQVMIDPLIVGIYTNTDRCLDDPFSIKKQRPFARTEAKMKNIFHTVNEDDLGENDINDDDVESQSLSFRKEGEGTLSEEEAANEKDVDSVEGDVYNSDDNYSLQSRNASSQECPYSEDEEEEEDKGSKESFSCHSENESIIEYQTEAPKHHPYDFKGFHFQAGKMYARKLYQLKEVCDNAAIDSDHQSSYDGDEDYAAEFLQGEIDKFLENTVDRITQDVREARNLIGGLKKGSDTNLDQTGVYYCNLSDRYINYVDSYFKKINRKRELQSDKAFLMEMLKQKAKEPDKIIKHIREYIICKKNGLEMELDENLMNLIPHVRPVEVKKKDRLGYEILTDDDDDDEFRLRTSQDEDDVPITENVRESIEPVNITTAELVERLGDSPKVTHLMDAVNNFKKFKDMETVNQLIELPLHECFSDVNIRNHLQSTKVNDGYFIDATIDGKVRESEDCETNLGFVTDPEHIQLSKDLEPGLSSQSEPEEVEQETKLKHMEILTNCGKETIKEADFFEPIYKQEEKYVDPFRPQKFRMFAPIDPCMLDSDSDGSINTRIKVKRRKALVKPPTKELPNVISTTASVVSTASTVSAVSGIQQRLDIDRTFGLAPIKQPISGGCRVGVQNMSVNDEVSHVDKAIALENILTMEDEIVNYIRNIEAYIHNLLISRRKERQSFKRNILETSRKGVRRANFKVLQEKLIEFHKLADEVSFDWDLLCPYLHLLLPQDSKKKFTRQTADYIVRLLIVDFVERELFKLKGLYYTYEKARQNVVEKKNMYVSKLENMSFVDKAEFEKAVISCNKALRRTADQAHILRFVILRRAKQSTKKFLKLINDIKKDQRINEAYSEARERLILTDLSKRWPEHFEFIFNFSGLPVASEQNDFTSSYISPVDDIVIRKVLKQVRKKPVKYQLTEKTYERYLELMERDREYFDGMRKKSETRKKMSIHSTAPGDKDEFNVDGKNSDFIDKLELVNDLIWGDFFFASESSEDVTQSIPEKPDYFSEEITRKMSFDICAKSLLEELFMIQRIESGFRPTKDSTRKKTMSNTVTSFEEDQTKKDMLFFEKYGTPEAHKHIQGKLPEYFEYI